MRRGWDERGGGKGEKRKDGVRRGWDERWRKEERRENMD